MAAALLFSGVALGQETRTYFVTDVVGSPVAAADAYGNAVWYEDYAPYGEQRISAPGSGSNQRWFTAAPQNADTGLIDAGQRYYSPEFGRFLSVDPVGVDGASGENFNRYGYANNNPYTYIDPDGQLPILLPLVIGYRIYSAYDTVTSTIDNTRTLRDPEASAGQKLRAGAEIAGAVIGGRLGRNAAGTTARVTDNAAEAARATTRVTGAALSAARKEFDSLRPTLWRQEAATNPARYSPSQLADMRAGRGPIGNDGYRMELHHRIPLANGGTNAFDNLVPLTRTEHRLGGNYSINHPGLP